MLVSASLLAAIKRLTGCNCADVLGGGAISEALEECCTTIMVVETETVKQASPFSILVCAYAREKVGTGIA